MRASARCPVDYDTIGEHLTLGDLELHVCNVSTTGFMVKGCNVMERGHRVIIRLPTVGRIEGCCVWTHDDGRAGFQFERIIRPDDYAAMIEEMQPKARVRVRA
jgi:hypothetical protein